VLNVISKWTRTWLLQVSHTHTRRCAIHLDAASGVCLWSCAHPLSLRPLLWGLIDSSQLIPANRPGLEIAQWQIKAGTDELILEIFQESPVESGLLDAIVLSAVLLRSGHSLGSSQAQLVLDNPLYSLTVLGLMGSY
jgi:hypothetical protein